jgi:hypothetical protein
MNDSNAGRRGVLSITSQVAAPPQSQVSAKAGRVRAHASGHASPSAQTNTTLTLPTDFPSVGMPDAEPAGEPRCGLGRSDGQRVVLADPDGEVACNHRVDRSRVVDHRPGHPADAKHVRPKQVRAPDTVVQGSFLTLCLGRSATGGRRHRLDSARWLTSRKPAMTGSASATESGSVTSSVLTQRLILTDLDVCAIDEAVARL